MNTDLIAEVTDLVDRQLEKIFQEIVDDKFVSHNNSSLLQPISHLLHILEAVSGEYEEDGEL